MSSNMPAQAPTAALPYGNWTPAVFVPHNRNIGGIVAQVTIEEQGTDELQITDHPVEQGAPISDHAFKRPVTVNITAGWSQAYAGNLSAETGVYGLLLSWQSAFMPFNVVTGKRSYSNMLIERLIITTDQHSEYALLAQIGCRQVIIVGTQTTQVVGQGATSAQANPENTAPTQQNGPTSTTTPDQGTQNTIEGDTVTNGTVEGPAAPASKDIEVGSGTIEGAPVTGSEASSIEGAPIAPSQPPPDPGSEPPPYNTSLFRVPPAWRQSPRSRRRAASRLPRSSPGAGSPTHYSSSGTRRATAGSSTSGTRAGPRRS
jgi:hypothetical protein